MVLNYKAVLGVMGALVFFVGVMLLAPMGVALGYGEPSWWSFAVTALGSVVVGGGAYMRWGRDASEDLRVREGFAIVALAWFVLSLVGALPFTLAGVLDHFGDAFFETMSGFTTTGATILGGATTPAVEATPHGFLLWRSLTHWLGGMGIIVLTLAVLPILGVGGMQLYKAEVPGPSADKLTPRVRETARRLWLIYVGMTVAQVLLLLPAMNLFDAVNHAFATMGTGGFSTKNGSVGQFNSAYVDWMISLFTFLAGMNFALHYRLLRGHGRAFFGDTELQVYTGIVVTASLVIIVGTWQPTMAWLGSTIQASATFEGYPEFWQAARYAVFQVVTIISTTGFATADYEVWSPLAQSMIFALFFVGGMAGSTGGGVKVVRVVLMLKNSFKEIKQLVHPQAVIPVRLNGEVVPREVMRNVLSFMVLYIGLIGVGTLLLMALGLDLVSAFSATFSAVGNVGPGFGLVGPTENYAALPMAGKWILSLLMMAGRLEIFTVLILFMPTFWRR